MGLDMHGFKTKNYPCKSWSDDCEEIAYWRKHPDLHRWMEDLWVARGGKIDNDYGSFCEQVVLTAEDIDHLEQDVLANALPKNEGGFFFGDSEWNAVEHKKDTLEFCRKAREAIAQGYTVFYDSSW